VTRQVKILETERLILREAGPADAAFVLDLLNQPSFIKYIADRGVRTLEQAREYIATRFINSYEKHGYGLYAMEIIGSLTPIGLCGFVNRETLPHPDIGFALLPQFEKQGYAFEAASAMLDHGKNSLEFERVLAITSLDNESSGRLLEKIGLRFEREIEIGGETLKLFAADL
jgi:[ribosomal protein S5]-alanine N-acetyltransferase